MTHIKTSFVLLVSSLILVIGFQNCSKIEATSPLVNEKLSGAVGAPAAVVDPVIDSPDSGSTDQVVDREEDEDSVNIVTGSLDIGEEQPKKSEAQQAAEAIAFCAQQGVDAIQGSEFKNIRGHLEAAGKDISSIEDVRGGLSVWGVDGESKIGHVSNIRGHTVICNMKVGSIDDVRGGVVLVNSSAESVDEVHGRLLMVNSKVNKVGSVTGSIASHNQ